jgi:hypothetical protein
MRGSGGISEVPMKIQFPLGALFGMLFMGFSAVWGQASEQQPSIERGPQMQFWVTRLFVPNGGGLVRVMKFQVGKTMVCKALYSDRVRELVEESNPGDDTIAMGLSLTSTSLGDVPCE